MSALLGSFREVLHLRQDSYGVEVVGFSPNFDFLILDFDFEFSI